MEDKSLAEFKGRERWLSLFDQQNPDFSQFTQVPGLESFVSQNKAEIENLAKQDGITRKVVNQFIKPDHDSLVQGLDAINADAETQKIVMREKTQAQIFDGINSKFGDKFMNFENRVSLTPIWSHSYSVLGRKGHALNGKAESHCRWPQC
jgi:hypothetical protein